MPPYGFIGQKENKTNINKTIKAMKQRIFLLAASALMLLAAMSCTTEGDGDYVSEAPDGKYEAYSTSGDTAGEGGGGDPVYTQHGNTEAGIVTAGEWNDLNHWNFWSRLMAGQDFGGKSKYWQCYTNSRVPVVVTSSSGTPLAAMTVKLMRSNATLWEAVTDNHGQAELWISPWQKSEGVDASSLRVSIDGRIMEQQPVVNSWDSLEQLTVNRYVVDTPAATVRQQADIAFVVDATGSMGDEINFLKSDLLDIMNHVSAVRHSQTIRTATLFYRDEGDEYLTRHSDFTADASQTAAFVENQQADGGGDYPEAVHTALEHMLQDLSWSDDARTRMAFLILDAPAHHNTDVILSLQQSLTACARRGIRIIPVAASGVNKETEFMLRFFATITGGTYVFLTDDSGVGLGHIKATVGDYEVEKLNELIIRLITLYTS